MSGANLRKGQSPFYGSDTIALVDLNYTLVENSPKWGAPKIYPFIRQIEQETYRQWLVDFLRDKYAILITARPQKYREATLERIKRDKAGTIGCVLRLRTATTICAM